MPEVVRVQVLFSEDTEFGQYTDAVYYTLDEYNNIDDKTHEALKKERVDNWKNLIINVPEPIEPTKEVLQQIIDEKQKYIDEEQSKLDILNAKLEEFKK